jgi:hypothetical protein
VLSLVNILYLLLIAIEFWAVTTSINSTLGVEEHQSVVSKVTVSCPKQYPYLFLTIWWTSESRMWPWIWPFNLCQGKCLEDHQWKASLCTTFDLFVLTNNDFQGTFHWYCVLFGIILFFRSTQNKLMLSRPRTELSPLRVHELFLASNSPIIK